MPAKFGGLATILGACAPAPPTSVICVELLGSGRQPMSGRLATRPGIVPSPNWRGQLGAAELSYSALESLQRSPDPLAVFKGAYF